MGTFFPTVTFTSPFGPTPAPSAPITALTRCAAAAPKRNHGGAGSSQLAAGSKTALQYPVGTVGQPPLAGGKESLLQQAPGRSKPG